MRALATWLLIIGGILSIADPVVGQGGRTSILAGYGAIDHEVNLGPAYHLNLRHQLVGMDSVALSPPGPGRRVLRGLAAEAELFAQTGRSGARVNSCTATAGQICIVGADHVYLLGAGVVSRVEITSSERPVHLYFLPLSIAAYARGYTATETPLSSMLPVEETAVRLSGGFGNGLGVAIRFGRVTALLEGRAVLIYDLGGGRGGSMPLGLGFRL